MNSTRRKIITILIGVIIVLLGVGIVGNAVGAWNFKVFIDGWWALLLMIMFLFSIISSPNAFNVCGMLVSGFVFLRYHIEALKSVNVWLIILGAVVLLIGIKLIIRSFRPSSRKIEVENENGEKLESSSCAFSTGKTDYTGKVFVGGKFTCSFGKYVVDLSGATVKKGAEMKLDCAFGNITVVVPAGVCVSVSKSSFVGSVSSDVQSSPDADLSVIADAAFGSINIVKADK